MSQGASFEIDLADPESLKKRLSDLDDIVREKERIARQANNDLSYWRSMRQRLQALVEPPPQKGGSPVDLVEAARGALAGMSIQAQVESLVDGAPGPVGASDILRHLPEDTKRETVNWALWSAAREGKIRRIQQGVYASNDYGVKTPQLLSRENKE